MFTFVMFPPNACPCVRMEPSLSPSLALLVYFQWEVFLLILIPLHFCTKIQITAISQIAILCFLQKQHPSKESFKEIFPVVKQNFKNGPFVSKLAPKHAKEMSIMCWVFVQHFAYSVVCHFVKPLCRKAFYTNQSTLFMRMG